ncbi:MAG: hypothetical protein LKE37_02190 [Atopobiaceae bacterium]|jgi:hypothetical protein|nr:hypothetical protein [Atopobiaceae bacterium]
MGRIVASPLARRIAILFAIALACELTLFNVRFWSTAGDTSVTLLDQETTLSELSSTLTYTGLDLDANDVCVTLAPDQGPELVHATCSISDEGSSVPYEAGVIEVQQQSELSSYQMIHPYSRLRSISLSFDTDDSEVRVASVLLNAPVPFSFDWVRLLFVWGVLLLASAFRPSGAVWHTGAFGPGLARRARVAAVVGGCAACVAVVACFPNLVQLSTSFYNQETWDGTSLVNESWPVWYGGYANDEYTALAHSLAKGQLWLDEQPPEWLDEMDNPYDYSQRVAHEDEEGMGYKGDAAFYQGHYYVYFGVVPVVLSYLPFYALTGQDFPNAMAVLLTTVLFVIGLERLLSSVARSRFPNTSAGVYLLVFLGVLLSSGALLGLGRATMYNVPQAFSRCLVVWGLWLWHRGWREGRKPLLAAGSLLMALVFGCRPQMFVFGAFLLPLLWWGWKHPGRERWAVGASLLVPFAVVAAGLMWYNAARFGSPLDLGANYNLASNDMTKRGFVPARALDGAFAYLLQPPQVVGAFPFLVPTLFATSYVGLTITEPMLGGAFATMPFLWSPFASKGLRRRSRDVFACIVCLLALALVVAVADAEGAGILGRYYQDFLPLLALAAALAFLEGASFGDSGLWGRALRVAFWLTLLFAALSFLFMCDSAGLYTSGACPPGIWEHLRQSIQFWG